MTDSKKECWEMLKKGGMFGKFKNYEEWLNRDGKREEKKEETWEQVPINYK